MHDRSAVNYVYDGSFEGFLSLVFESWCKKELPAMVFPAGGELLTLFPSCCIETDDEKAFRVEKGIIKAAGAMAFYNVERCFLSCTDQKELLLLDYIRLCIRHGSGVLSMLADDTVHAVEKAVFACTREGHLYKGFVRFSVHGDVMTAVIEPKHSVLPLIADHFCERYHAESFVIYDKTHGSALIFSKGNRAIVPAEGFEPPRADTGEIEARRLWKLFYDTIAIEQRDNPRCRMSMMPKRFWSRLTEMEDEPESPALTQDGDSTERTIAGTDERVIRP